MRQFIKIYTLCIDLFANIHTHTHTFLVIRCSLYPPAPLSDRHQTIRYIIGCDVKFHHIVSLFVIQFNVERNSYHTMCQYFSFALKFHNARPVSTLILVNCNHTICLFSDVYQYTNKIRSLIIITSIRKLWKRNSTEQQTNQTKKLNFRGKIK